ncbi:MAG: BrnA antitoxin family protein [Magnetococcus sp. DMHC-8]
MKKEYDFSKGRRGPVLPPTGSKQQIIMRVDTDILGWFRQCVEQAGGGDYLAMMNDALRAHMERNQEPLAEAVRRVIREELQTASVRATSVQADHVQVDGLRAAS